MRYYGLLAPPIMTVLFLGWALYHAFIKKDIKNHTTELLAGVMFMSIWIIILYVSNS